MKCAVCGAMGTVRWVIDNGTNAGVAWACVAHSAPLEELLGAAGTLPPPASDGHLVAPVVINRGRRVVKPLEWSPPE